MRISARGLQMIKNFEGVRLHPYKDAANKWTLGVGHLMTPAESIPGITWPSQGGKATPVGEITQEECDRLLRLDVERFERAVQAHVTIALSQRQFDALVSWAFNVGEEALRTSTLVRLLNAGKHPAAAAEFVRWNHIGKEVSVGLTIRRILEAAYFLGWDQWQA